MPSIGTSNDADDDLCITDVIHAKKSFTIPASSRNPEVLLYPSCIGLGAARDQPLDGRRGVPNQLPDNSIRLQLPVSMQWKTHISAPAFPPLIASIIGHPGQGVGPILQPGIR